LEAISGYKCLDTGRSSLCFLSEKNVIRTIYARLTVIAIVFSIVSLALSLYTLMIFSPFLLLFFYYLSPFVPFKKNIAARAAMAFFGWGSFAIIAYMGVGIIFALIPPTSHWAYEEWFADALTYMAIAITMSFTALSMALKPVIGLEVEKDPKRYRFAWWIVKRYYFLKLLWSL